MTSCRRKKSIEITVWSRGSLPFYQHYEKWKQTGAAIGCSRKFSRKARMRWTVYGCHSNDQRSTSRALICWLQTRRMWVSLFSMSRTQHFFYKVIYSDLGHGPWVTDTYNVLRPSMTWIIWRLHHYKLWVSSSRVSRVLVSRISSSLNTIENSLMPNVSKFPLIFILIFILLSIYFYENLHVCKCCIGNGC